MSDITNITIKPFQPADQEAVRALVLAGLTEHWGTLDPTKNSDLNDICTAYAGATFLVAWEGGSRIVGSGALVSRGSGAAEIVRMSVAADMRRRGVGRRILARLVAQAREDDCQRIVLETTETWQAAVSFYLRSGFQITHYADGDVYFTLELRR